MVTLQTMNRTLLGVDGTTFPLAQGVDVDDLKRRIEEAVETSGRFVNFVVVGNRPVSVLFTPHSSVHITDETVQFDPRDTGEESAPFGGFFDHDLLG
ncbi:hypothetical protein [Microbacterium sp.]|uniref:hypothetical protein n=1 Tax=Microbacterium sp. TaxID=51671 RepID=UPI002810E4EF|nr:hypothetical protein [Microbacterium sp.]